MFKSPYKLRTRIYVSMLALLIGSFFFIGISTFYNFKTQNTEYHNKRLQRKEVATIASIDYFLNEQKQPPQGSKSIYNLFQTKIYELSDVHNLDLNIYNISGELIISSNKELHQEGLIPRNMSPETLKALSVKGKRIDKRLTNKGEDYLNSYQYLNDTKGNPIAIISIPYFQLDETYKRDLRDYLLALSPIYIVLFLVASILAFVLSRQITEPLRRLSAIMRKAALMKRYMPLRWNSSDEVGQLVHQYNFMVKELEKSADILAQTQKESAWREMAKQVAHEIKNPLTPMKLNVQLFERQLKADDPDFEEKLKTFSHSIIEQIDTLAHIASAFSGFAQMPNSNKEKLHINNLVERAVSFYDAANINLNLSQEELYVFADRDQFIRVLNNLLNNAIEAIPDEVHSQIEIGLFKRGKEIHLTVKDNGLGIPEELQEKIFEPNFTTKNSGMGLGLALVKRIIDDVNGEIYFKSELNKGTTFFIKLPAYDQKS